MKRIVAHLRGFAQEEKGLALTEYLLLLGMMTGGVVLSTVLFASSLAQAWAGSMQVLSLPALSASTVPSGAQTGSGNEVAAQPPAQEEEVVTASLQNPSARDDDDDDDDDDEEARDNGNRGNSDCRGRRCRDRD
jgi:pilus assembly protein Flp/PilA